MAGNLLRDTEFSPEKPFADGLSHQQGSSANKNSSVELLKMEFHFSQAMQCPKNLPLPLVGPFHKRQHF
jgi:hypothetical protein